MSNHELHLTLLETEFEHILDQHASAQRAKRRRAPRIGAEAALRDRSRDRRFRQLLDALPAAVYTTDANGRITFFNEAAAELWGCRPELGTAEFCGSWRLFWPDGTPLPHDQCPMAVALREGRPVRGAEAIAERPDGTRVPFIPYPTPLRGSSGELVGAVNMLVDITERKRADERQALLIRELNHRVKNMLATVQAIMSSTARAAGSVAEFQDAFTGRIVSLARAHARISEGQWQTISFRDLLCDELAPYDDGRRVRLDGPVVDLTASLAVPLTMALHELTTNAVKHGALAAAGGSVAVSWALMCGRELEFEWLERGGPRVAPPTRRGFGSQLVQRVLTSQIGARVAIAYEPDGLRARVAVPLPDNRSLGLMDSLAPL
jgi:PAS domain S-box-containing protein